MSTKNLCDLGYFLQNYRTELLQDEFHSYTSGGGAFTTFTTNSGTVAADDTAGSSKILLTTGTTAGNFVGTATTNAPYLVAAGRPVFAQGRLTYANQATTTGEPFFGLASTTTLTMTSSLDPLASYSGALIYKRAGDTVWSVQSSNGSTKTTTQTNIVGTDGSYDLRVDMQDRDGTNADVTFLINGVMATDVNNRPIKHVLAIASLVKQKLICGVQTSTNNAQTAYFDFACGGSLRSGL